MRYWQKKEMNSMKEQNKTKYEQQMEVLEWLFSKVKED